MAAARRDFLKLGLVAGAGLTLPDLLRLRAAAGQSGRDTAVIFVQMGGGPSQHETFDPKPAAPQEYRGAFQSIATAVPGVRFCELWPRLASLMKDLAIVRSVGHHEGSHTALHVVECGYFLRSIANARNGEMPAVGSVVARVRGGSANNHDRGLPAFVSLARPVAYCGPAHLGAQYAPFVVNGDPSAANFEVANLALGKGLTTATLQDRQTLLRSLDAVSRALDDHETAQAIDAFQAQALDLLTGERARAAFELSQEPAPLRDRYGRTDVGQRMLLARRLVEAGVPFAAVRFSPGVSMADWDDHQALPAKMSKRSPIYDQGLAALIEDLRDRGLSQRVLVVAMGEFGRTPRVNKDAGRDHWPAVHSVLLSGGDYRMGQVIGATDSVGGAVTQAPYKPQSVLAMAYRHLGIDPGLTFPDFTGRPRHVLEEREPIVELL
jgi:uncharacterized protein (DUF1501 family)